MKVVVRHAPKVAVWFEGTMQVREELVPTLQGRLDRDEMSLIEAHDRHLVIRTPKTFKALGEAEKKLTSTKDVINDLGLEIETQELWQRDSIEQTCLA